MSTGKIQETNGIKLSIEEGSLSNARKRILERELSKPHLVYDNIALTDNYIIAMDTNGSPNGAFASIEYKDLVWIYIGDGAINHIRVLSLAKGGDEKRAEKSAKITIAGKIMTGLVDTLMVGIPTNIGDQSVMIAFSKDRTAILASDSKTRLFSYKPSKNFRELIDVIASRGPEGLMVGDQYEDDFCEMMGIESFRGNFGVLSDDYGEGDGGDDLL